MSPNALFVSIGSYDEKVYLLYKVFNQIIFKVRLINSLTWKIIIEWPHTS